MPGRGRPAGTGEHTRGGVLVDVDGTEGSLPAVEFAYRYASLRALPLTAVHVVSDGDVRADRDEHLVGVSVVLAESVAGMRERFPDVHDTLTTVRGLRERRLVRGSGGLDLLVVASYQPSQLHQAPVDTVATTVIEHAACTVAVIPASTTLVP